MPFEQNIDPYGNESLVIPSTRCTYYSAIDYAGSIPTAMNASLNSTMPNLILGVQTYLQKRSAAPHIRFPAAGVNFEVHKEDLTSSSPLHGAGRMKSWSLDDVDDECIFVNDSFDPAEAEYRSTYLVRINFSGDAVATPVPSPALRLPSSEGWSSSSAEGSILTSSLSRARSSNSLRTPAEAPAVLTRQDSTASNRSGRRVPHSSSESSVRSMFSQSSNATLLAAPSSVQTVPRRSLTEDLLVAELIVDTRSFPAGYNVSTVWKRPPSTAGSSSDATSPHLPLAIDGLRSLDGVPLQITISSLSPSVLHSASLSTSPPRRRHLVRLTLPTGQFSKPPVQDPLRGDQWIGPPRPKWYQTLEGSGAALQLMLDPLAGQPYDDEGEVLVTVNGAVVTVSGGASQTGVKSAKHDKSEAYDDVAVNWPRLTRSARRRITPRPFRELT